MLETLFNRDIIIDVNKKVAGVLLTSEKTDRKTGEKFVFDGIGFYQLRVDESDSIKISDLRIFCDDPDKLSRVYFRSV